MAYLGASGDIFLGAARETSEQDDFTRSTSKNLLRRKTTTDEYIRSTDTAATSSVSGGLTAIVAQGNIVGEGVRISGDEGVLVQAGGTLDLHEARNLRYESRETSTQKSGLAGSFMGAPLFFGTASIGLPMCLFLSRSRSRIRCEDRQRSMRHDEKSLLLICRKQQGNRRLVTWMRATSQRTLWARAELRTLRSSATVHSYPARKNDF